MTVAERMNSRVVRQINGSGIRRITELARTIPGAINLSIGQPDFPVPEGIKRAAVEAITQDRNGYSANAGLDPLCDAVAAHLRRDVGWSVSVPGRGASGSEMGLMITAGTSAAIMLACMAMLEPGDEIIIPDPYFVIYPPIAALCGATLVRCDTYPDFRLTAERVARLITPRTKIVLANSPGNPSGVVMTSHENADLLALCRSRDVLLISDEIYDEFTYSESATEPSADGARRCCPSPARHTNAAEHTLLVRGFGKTYGVTGWRLGFAAGPMALIEQMLKLQQYTFVCAPTPLQWGAVEALRTDMTAIIRQYQARRDLVVERLSKVTEVERPGGAYYAFPRVPKHLGLSATQFAARCVEEKVLVIPGHVFSEGVDTHLRLSFAVKDDVLERGLDVLVRLMR